MFITQIIIIILLLIFSAIFSLIEASFLSVSSVQVHAFLREKKHGAQALARLKQEPERLIISMLAANTFVNFAAVTIFGVLLMSLYPDYGMWIATVVMTIVVLLLSQVTPKIIAERNPEPVALFFAGSAETFSHILFPIVVPIEKFAFKIADKFRGKGNKVSEEEFESMVSIGKKDGILSAESADIMRNVLVFQNTPLARIMTPKANVLMVGAEERLNDIIPKMLKAQRSRVPVYEDKDTKIVGVLSTTAILRSIKAKKSKAKVRTIMDDVLIVPETKNVQDLFYELQAQGRFMAVVVNEYGSFMGIVTVHDILKLIVGNVELEAQEIKPKRSATMLGKTTIEEFNAMFGTKIVDKDIKTVAGLIEKELQRIPEKGEKIQIRGFNFEATRVTRQVLQEVKVTRQS